MSEKLSETELDLLRNAFKYLINFESEDPCELINPLTYVSPDGDTCLHIAAHQGNILAVKLLVKAGLDVNQKGDMGYTSLHYAASEEIVEFLLANGASKFIKNEFGKSPLGWKEQ